MFVYVEGNRPRYEARMRTLSLVVTALLPSIALSKPAQTPQTHSRVSLQTAVMAPSYQYKPKNDCERRIIASAAATQAQLEAFIADVTEDMQSGTYRLAHVREARAETLLKLLIAFPGHFDPHFGRHFWALALMRRKLAAPQVSGSALSRSLDTILSSANAIASKYTEVMLSQPGHWTAPCPARPSDPPTPSERAQHEAFLKRMNAAIQRHKACERLIDGWKPSKNNAERLAFQKRFARCNRQAETDRYRCLETRGKMVYRAKAQLKKPRAILVRFMRLAWQKQKLSKDELRAIRGVVEQALDQLEPPMSKLSYVAAARRSIKSALTSKVPKKHLARASLALSGLSSLCYTLGQTHCQHEPSVCFPGDF